jgi:hypothetical protein
MGVDVDPGWQLDAVGSKDQGLLPKKEGLRTTALFIGVERRELGGGRDLHEFSMDPAPPGNQSWVASQVVEVALDGRLSDARENTYQVGRLAAGEAGPEGAVHKEQIGFWLHAAPLRASSNGSWWMLPGHGQPITDVSVSHGKKNVLPVGTMAGTVFG